MRSTTSAWDLGTSIPRNYAGMGLAVVVGYETAAGIGLNYAHVFSANGQGLTVGARTSVYFGDGGGFMGDVEAGYKFLLLRRSVRVGLLALGQVGAYSGSKPLLGLGASIVPSVEYEVFQFQLVLGASYLTRFNNFGSSETAVVHIGALIGVMF